MKTIVDGPVTPNFTPVSFRSRVKLELLGETGVSREMREAADMAPSGECVFLGLPFRVNRVAVVAEKVVTMRIRPTRAEWFVVLHTSDVRPDPVNKDGFISPMHGIGKLGEHAADYVFVYEDGSEVRVPIRRRYEIGPVQRIWGENCAECVPHATAAPMKDLPEQGGTTRWGRRQSRVDWRDLSRWTNWLWAFRNSNSRKAVVAIRLEPVCGIVVLSALSAGKARSHPLRWERRKKAVLRMPRNTAFDSVLDESGLYKQVQLDLGQVISVEPRFIYPNHCWPTTRQNLKPEESERELIVEFAAHPDARFHLWNGRTVPVSRLKSNGESKSTPLSGVRPSDQRVRIVTRLAGSREHVPVKLHLHGEDGEYLAPVDRHRIPNKEWFEDYGTEYCHGPHRCSYIPGTVEVDLPLGKVYVEVTKGFEIRPVRKVVRVKRSTREIVIELDKVLLWRERGWVTADTHVHFLSPATAMLEGSAEGVNLINLLASQWGELMSNVGDFDGKTTFGSREAGGEGEYLVRVGTENRQHVLGHISLLGYGGEMINPMCSGGPNESAIGDPVEILMTEWARKCKEQGGLVIMPHFPQPRMENAACLVLEEIDGIEMCSWGDLYSGISPYSLSDWYRYLNNGYLVAAVGGTDKMSADTAVGTIRTYARIGPEEEFTNESWMNSVRGGETFCTYGPLLEFAVDGKTMGSRFSLSSTGGTVDVTWKAASVYIPMTRVELVVNGEIRESQSVNPSEDEGSWTVKVDRSSWLALLVRAKYSDPDKPEMIGAHSTPVMIDVAGSPFYAEADAVTILEQIEASIAYLDIIGTRAEGRRYKQMRLVLESAYRRLHNRMHERGFDHDHSHATDHAEHH